MQSKQDLRSRLISQRNNLTILQQQQAAAAVNHIIKNLALFKTAQHIAFYWPIQQELDPQPSIITALQARKSCYLPIIPNSNLLKQLQFLPFDFTTKLIPNRFEILEPELINPNLLTPAATMDLIFLPIVGVDHAGYRLGMGGGYYDFTCHDLDRTKTKLIGLAYAYQLIEQLPVDPWDVKLDGVVTPEKFIATD